MMMDRLMLVRIVMSENPCKEQFLWFFGLYKRKIEWNREELADNEQEMILRVYILELSSSFSSDIS
jgi:hypothetical protein